MTSNSLSALFQVGETEFQLDTTLPVLRADRNTYVFAMPGDRLFYHLNIPPGLLLP